MSWADLPVEVLDFIRQRLFGEDYSNFRATCRGWNFRTDFDRVVYENVKYPFLIRFCDSGVDRSYSCCKAYLPAYDKTYHVHAPSRLFDAHIFSSNYGWLLLARGTRAFFYHPSTERIIKLPVVELNAFVPFQSMSFWGTPTSPDCVVIGVMDSESKKNSCFSIIQRGQHCWRHYSHVPNRMRLQNYDPKKLISDDIKKIRVKPTTCEVNIQKYSWIGNFLWSDYSCSPVFYNEAFYYLAQDGRLGVFHPKEKKANKMWRLIDLTKRPDVFMDNPRNQAYLVVCKGELISIVVAPMGKYVRILKFNEDYKVWRIVDSLENQMILLSSTGCMAITCDDVKLKRLANTIHLPRLDQNHHHVFYSISTEQFLSFRGDYISYDLYDTKLLLGSAWVIPTFSISYGPQPHWSSKLQRLSLTPKNSEHRPIHPHFVIRNLIFLVPPNNNAYVSARKQLNDDVGSKKIVMQEAPIGKPCFVFTDGEGEGLLVNLDKDPIINHLRDMELATRIGSKAVLCSAYTMLVLLDGRTCSLLDPMSMVEITLPTWEATFFISSSILLHGDSKWLVMAFGCNRRDKNLELGEIEDDEEDAVMLWQEGDTTWAAHKMPSNQGIDATRGVVRYQEKIYGLDATFRLTMMELRSERCNTRPMTQVGFPISYSPGNGTDKYKLVESCDELLLFILYYQDGYRVAQRLKLRIFQ